MAEHGLRKILIVDDEEHVLRALQRELRGMPYSVTTCDGGNSALDEIRKEEFALIITDNRMPGMTGIELLEHAKQISPDTSRIVLTGYTDLGSVVNAINNGEINYFITKPWERDNLLELIAAGLEKHDQRVKTRELSSSLKDANMALTLDNEMLKSLATRDGMTGLCNHAEFQSNLARQIKLFGRDHQPFCLAMGDIDNFKRVNDTYGHPVGDAVIKCVARVLRTALREEVDTSHRYGGEEFAVLMRNTTESTGHMVMSRIIKKIADERVDTLEGGLSVTMSFGVGEFDPSLSAAGLVARVDRALYAAKHGGKNQVVMTSSLSQAI